MLVGMELGKKDTHRASYIFIISMLACLLTGLALTACGVLAPDVVTRLLCDHDQLYQPTYKYLRVMLIGAPAYLLMWGVDTMVSVDGSPRLVSISILVDNVVHLVLDVVFIKYFGWGIEGSSCHWSHRGHRHNEYPFPFQGQSSAIHLWTSETCFWSHHLAGSTTCHCLNLPDGIDVRIKQDHIVVARPYRNLRLCPLHEPSPYLQPVSGRSLPYHTVAGFHPGGKG